MPIMRTLPLVFFCVCCNLSAQQTSTKREALPLGKPVEVRLPSEIKPTPDLTSPQVQAVQTPVRDSFTEGAMIGQLKSDVTVHNTWIKELQEKVSSLEDTRTWIRAGFWAGGIFIPFALGLLYLLRHMLFKKIHDETFPETTH